MIARVTRRQVLVQLDDAHVAALDRLAAGADQSRSELIRRAIELYVDAVGEAVADIRYAAAYTRVPEDLEEFAALRAAAAWPPDAAR